MKKVCLLYSNKTYFFQIRKIALNLNRYVKLLTIKHGGIW